MRVPLLVAVLLAGCASAPEDAPTPSTSDNDATRPPTGTGPWSSSNGSWRYTVDPSVVRGNVGDAVDVVITVTSDEPGRSARLTIGSSWIDAGRPAIDIENSRGSLATRVYLGAPDLTLDADLYDVTADRRYGLEGPPVRVQDAERAIAFERLTSVSDHAPGLSVEVDGRTVRVTYSARANATTTGDEAVSAESPIMLVRAQNETRLVAFAHRMQNDAIQYFPEPQRSRIAAEVTDLPAGDVRVIVVSDLWCFCGRLPPPVVDEQVVRVV